jgi:hypothetical protein
MNLKKSLLNNSPRALYGVVVLGAIVLASGCSTTLVPIVPTATVASWDGTNQDSGLIGTNLLGRWIITAHARDRYNGLVLDYGIEFYPPVDKDDGIQPTEDPTRYQIDQQHLAYFAAMNRWKREGRPAAK